ncbi:MULTISPECIES: ribosome recycling factor [unclassified Roseofilum]|uniref:ribosome recycling factor n=1 Tax=unclassified Roseofilum TaxID=2620099 RepID=UPI000E8155AE|nr:MULTISPECIES: ribosome recycling factor [unclassified Roseofilum]MBP0008094.1 ribosome recycling factor [Roseofilum sp. Belize Diploria]MBP0034499.1 ribosome recycling factor [Roseofilum sp. Belize BBD 4]HBQ97094.1 ribosome recycling factor [Cyanobacteria bacterium UBA11691]
MQLSDVEELMQKAVESTRHSFNTIRTGRANSSLLDRVMVEYYGTPTPLKSLANISTPDSSTLMIQPYDKGSLNVIEKAISLSDLGLTPNNDGQCVRLNIPQLTEERRKELVKQVAKLAEEGRVSVRNNRRQGIDDTRKKEKNGDITEDESRNLQDEIQKLTDKYINRIDDLLADKEKDITKV